MYYPPESRLQPVATRIASSGQGESDGHNPDRVKRLDQIDQPSSSSSFRTPWTRSKRCIPPDNARNPLKRKGPQSRFRDCGPWEEPAALLRAWGQRQVLRGSPVHGSFAEIQRTRTKMGQRPGNKRAFHRLVMFMDEMSSGLPILGEIPKRRGQRRAFPPALQRDPNGHPFSPARAAEGLHQP